MDITQWPGSIHRIPISGDSNHHFKSSNVVCEIRLQHINHLRYINGHMFHSRPIHCQNQSHVRGDVDISATNSISTINTQTIANITNLQISSKFITTAVAPPYIRSLYDNTVVFTSQSSSFKLPTVNNHFFKILLLTTNFLISK